MFSIGIFLWKMYNWLEVPATEFNLLESYAIDQFIASIYKNV
jgi:hypothetical protein